MVITGKVGILQTLIGHQNDVITCDFGNDFTLVTGSGDKTVRLWEWIPGTGYQEKPHSPLQAHKYQVTCVRISPQGSMLASSSVDGTAILWNLHAGTRLHTMVQVNNDAIRACSSILVTAGDNGAVCIWDLVHRSLIRSLFEHEGTAQSLAFTPDSQYLVSACTLEMIKVWYVQDLVDTTAESSPVPSARFDNAHDLGVFCVDIRKKITVDENDHLVKRYTMASCGNSQEIKIWTITARSTLKHKSQAHQVSIDFRESLDGHTSSVTCVRYSSSSLYLVSSSLDKLVKVWDEEGNCVATLEGHNRYVNCVAISRDSALIASGSTGSNDKLVIIWNLQGGLTRDSELVKQRLSLGVGTQGSISESELMRNAESNDNEVKLIERFDDVADGAVNSCSFSASGILATGSGDKLVRLFGIRGDNGSLEELNCSPLEGHTYAVNHVEFSPDGTRLASCSLDGSTILWSVETGERIASLPRSGSSVKVCRFSHDAARLVTAGDDERATIWNLETGKELAILEGHLDAVTSACFSPDSALIATTSTNADFRLWRDSTKDNIYTKEDAHDYGIQSCDFSHNPDPIPNNLVDVQSYLLATCGNDSLVKLWRISVPRKKNNPQFEAMEVKMWRSLQGHGGHVFCVRFSSAVSEIVCSAASDRQARIWSVCSADCLFVLDHDSIVASCAFSSDCSLFATGCLDKTLRLWTLPQQLVFRTVVSNKIKCRTKALVHWTTGDVVKWLGDVRLDEITENVTNSSLDGKKILSFSEEKICSGLGLDEAFAKRLSKELRWLKQDDLRDLKPINSDVPHEFLCPITHEIMREPVTCSDGYTYEKNAIAEWFMSGKYTSPLTNETLATTVYAYNLELRNAIHSFLDNEQQ